MDKFLYEQLLYDFYAQLLTQHQQKVMSLRYEDDLSLAEIGEITGLSRQGVHDLIKRAQTALEKYESKLKLVEKEFEEQKTLDSIISELQKVKTSNEENAQLLSNCIHKLEELKA